ncbi:MAG: M48 family metalloprotease [Myxococcota bacterium]
MTDLFTAAELAEIEAYHFPHYLWGAVGDAVNLGVFALVLRFLVHPLYRWCEYAAATMGQRLSFLLRMPFLRVVPSVLEKLWGGPGWGAAVCFAAADCLLVALLFLPLDVYFDYLHEHRYGLSRYTPAGFALDHFKSVVLILAPTTALAFGLFGLARRTRHWWMLLGGAGAAVLLVSASLDPFRARAFFEQTPLPSGRLSEKISALMVKAGIEVRAVVVEKTSRASARVQAYFAGMGPTRTIVLNDRLLEELSEEEILAAVAHEAGHVHQSRWPSYLGSAVALGAFLFLVNRMFVLAAARGWFGTTRFADIRTLPLITLMFYLASGAAQPVSAAFSRERERAADLYALRLTRDPDSFRRMLVKAARINKTDPDPPRWVVLKSHSHPSILERIAAVDRGDWKL